MDDSAAEFERHRSRLFGLAYRMLGSAEEAEDVVQDTFLRWHQAEASAVQSAGAWLARVATNLCLTRLTSARARREKYVGPWLPEPVPCGALGPPDTAERRESVTLAFLVLLERLNPMERAVFVLRAAFDYSYRWTAETVGSSEAHCRQLYRRARHRLAEAPGGERVPGRVDRARQRELVGRFLKAAEEGDMPALERMLAEDVTVWVDGGGRIRTARRPVSGAARVARYLVGGLAVAGGRVTLSMSEVNGEPGLLALADGELIAVVVPETAGSRISGLRIIANPDKLRFFLRLSHPRALSGS